jgi:hypothetical protein
MFFRPNVDAIVADVQSKIDMLNKAVEHFDEEANDLQERAAELIAESNFSKKEAQRASKLAKKFEELLNV